MLSLNEGRDRSPGDSLAPECGGTGRIPLNEGRDRSPGDSANWRKSVLRRGFLTLMQSVEPTNEYNEG